MQNKATNSREKKNTIKDSGFTKFYEKLKSTNSKLILQIHDELIIEADEKEKDAIISLLKNSMENACKLAVPLLVEVGCGKSWFDCK